MEKKLSKSFKTSSNPDDDDDDEDLELSFFFEKEPQKLEPNGLKPKPPVTSGPACY